MGVDDERLGAATAGVVDPHAVEVAHGDYVEHGRGTLPVDLGVVGAHVGEEVVEVHDGPFSRSQSSISHAHGTQSWMPVSAFPMRSIIAETHCASSSVM